MLRLPGLVAKIRNAVIRQRRLQPVPVIVVAHQHGYIAPTPALFARQTEHVSSNARRLGAPVRRFRKDYALRRFRQRAYRKTKKPLFQELQCRTVKAPSFLQIDFFILSPQLRRQAPQVFPRPPLPMKQGGFRFIARKFRPVKTQRYRHLFGKRQKRP